MSLLSDLKTLLAGKTINIPAETGVFTTTPAPAVFCVLTPLGETLQCADDKPVTEVPSVRIDLYDKGNYTATAKTIRKAIVNEGLTISQSRYIEHEDDTGYYHYAIDVESVAQWEE